MSGDLALAASSHSKGSSMAMKPRDDGKKRQNFITKTTIFPSNFHEKS